MIDVQPHSLGAIFRVLALPGSRRAELRGVQNGALKVAVTVVAEKGKANRALISLLCNRLGLRRSQLELITGQTASEKRLLVRELTPEELQHRVQAALAK